MAATNSWVPVTTAATLVASGDWNSARYYIRNGTGPNVFLGGGTTVAGTSGYQLGSAEALSVTLDAGESLYAVAASGTAQLQVLGTGANN
jgi:hypothetical protein